MFAHNNTDSRGEHMNTRRCNTTPAAICMLVAAMLTLSAAGAAPCPLAPAKVKTADEAVARAALAIAAYRIGTLKSECMAMVANKQKTGYLVDVREIHNEACGGDPMTEPRAFSVDVAWNGKMKSDAYNHQSYLPLVCPKA
jgi:hypothetical protein